MPSLQTALPPELANNVIRVEYHFLVASIESMLAVIIQIPNFHGFNRSFTVNVFDELNILAIRSSLLLGHPRMVVLMIWNRGNGPGSQILLWPAQHNTELLVNMVRQQFKRNKHETDPEKIQKLKDDAARGLINHILYESERLSGRKVSKST
ncbi:hypothetical protein SADUNF_Sadunf10G0115600 [Salix dunnii]|uniref:Complex 1 LYR protein domain-containing protein n=1 Tax=Salix dunnii TaxID=1413687 RepID=A0A835JNB9_9ROSI|nr:hypothetical protein SADUNF_Sadunf10G0115600 [Salix dunnii]